MSIILLGERELEHNPSITIIYVRQHFHCLLPNCYKGFWYKSHTYNKDCLYVMILIFHDIWDQCCIGFVIYM